MKYYRITSFLCFLLLFSSCSKTDSECNGVCSAEYRTIVVSIEDGEGNPVALNKYKVIDLKDGRDLSLDVSESEFQMMRERGTYPIFSDKHFRDYARQELNINFTGFIEGEKVVSEDYKVGADCCHVYYVAGVLELEL